MVGLFRSRKRDRRSDRHGQATDLVDVDAEWIYRELNVHASVTGPADRAAAESVISELYRLSQLSSPEFVWVDSPAAADGLWRREPDGSQIKHRLLGWRMDDGPTHGIDPGDPTYPVLSGTNMWPLMLGTKVAPDILARRMELWAVLLRSAGWWWPTKTRCIVSEPPDEVHLEPTLGWQVLHCEAGPALRYRDGTAFHAWHGVIVPEKVIAGELTVHDWRSERNSERRRAMAERMGYAWLLEHSDAEQIAERPNSSLWRVPNQELDDDEHAALCMIPSGRVAEEDRPKDIMLVHVKRGNESSVLRIDSVREYYDTF
jgi:Domain of unknown function (DUF6745)